MSDTADRFWETKPLNAMSDGEWEALCDGCGRCCLVKLQEDETDAIYFTDVACKLFDVNTCRCGDYANRSERVPDCVRLKPEVIGGLNWMPQTCAYRLLDAGQPLPEWHPLITGRAESVIEAGISVKGRVHALEQDVSVEEIIDRIRMWPSEWPKAGKRKKKKV